MAMKKLFDKTIGRWPQSWRDMSRLIVTFLPGPTGVRSRLKYYRRLGASLAEGVELYEGVSLDMPQCCTIGKRSVLYANTSVAVHQGGVFVMGDHSHLSKSCYVLAGSSQVKIGNGTAIGPQTVIVAFSNQSLGEIPVIESTAGSMVTIGNDVLIGAHATILPGVTIGDHAVCAAGAVITQDVPAWHMVAGVPAKFLRDRRDQTSA